MGGRGAVFVLPVTTAGERGPVAAWLSAAGWAAATQRVIGRSWIVTPDGTVDPDEARRRGSDRTLTSDSVGWWRRHIPVAAKTAAKDFREWRRGRHFRVDPAGPWHDADITFVWQRHELFHTAGLDLARALGAPSVLFVPAVLVWQAQQWDVARPGWARALERAGEQRALQRADLVACGSDVVAEQVHRLGVPETRTIVTPTGADLDVFAGLPDPAPLRRRLGLDGQFVVGWVGSFRRFHAVEQAVDAIAPLTGASLLLVGDGPERPRIEALARRRGVEAVFTGTVPHEELPGYLAVMDAGLLVAPPGRSFHYSPLKLAEYLAAGLPVVAARAGQLADRLTDGVEAMLVDAGDVPAMTTALRTLQADPVRRTQLRHAARAAAEAGWSWDHQVRRVLDALADRRA